MPALDSVVTDFLTSIKDSLSTGAQTSTPGDGNTNAAPLNYLRAQDMASVLELLQDALDQATNLTVVSGSTTTVVDGAATFVAGAQAGNTITFDAATTTTALQGLSFTVTSNTTTTLTTELMPGTPVTGDLYTIQGAFVQGAVDALRGTRDGSAQTIGAAPPGNVYGDMRTVADALSRLTVQLGQTQNERNLGRPGLVTIADSTTTVVQLEGYGQNYRVDQFRGAKIVVGSEDPRIVTRSDETSVTVNKALSAAPAASVAVTITVAADQAHKTFGKLAIHPGAQPGENIFLSDLIQQAEDAVVAFTLPT